MSWGRTDGSGIGSNNEHLRQSPKYPISHSSSSLNVVLSHTFWFQIHLSNGKPVKSVKPLHSLELQSFSKLLQSLPTRIMKDKILSTTMSLAELNTKTNMSWGFLGYKYTKNFTKTQCVVVLRRCKYNRDGSAPDISSNPKLHSWVPCH